MQLVFMGEFFCVCLQIYFTLIYQLVERECKEVCQRGFIFIVESFFEFTKIGFKVFY